MKDTFVSLSDPSSALTGEESPGFGRFFRFGKRLGVWIEYRTCFSLDNR